MSTSSLRSAPIAVMIYRRPEHLRRTLTALKNCHHVEQHDIHVFGDGPRTAAETESVAEARAVATELLGSAAHYHFRDHNRGLSNSVIAAVDQLTSTYGDVIVLEDDLILAPDALNFLQQGLNHYRNDDRVMQISAYMFSGAESNLPNNSESMFLPFTTSWGWATWQRAWAKFDATASGWQTLQHDATLRRRFNLEGVYDFYSMLKSQMHGKRDSWAIRWYWSVFKENGLVAYPPHTFVQNTGFDGSGTHGKATLRGFTTNSITNTSKNVSFNKYTEIDATAYKKICALIYIQNGGLIGKITDRIKSLIAK